MNEINSEIKLDENDFKQAFEFSVKYFLNKNLHSGRTSGEPRGLGAVLDSFTRGKLVEIAVKKMLTKLNKSKKYLLDFEMRRIEEVANEPDVLYIIENQKKRDPKIFLEIKNTSAADRWIGLTEEQLSTMISGSKGNKIYNIFNSLSSKPNSDNTSSADFVGMYLKHISNLDLFQEFANLNAISTLEFIISKDDLIKYGTRFPAGKDFYETNIFCNTTTIWKKDGQLKKDIIEYRSYKDCNTSIFVPREDGSEDHEYGKFKIKGSFDWYRKHNKKSQRDFIYCKSPTKILSEVFGKFTLPEKALCKFNLVTIGRDPVLKRNNIWISKRRIHQLVKDGKIKEHISILRHIANNI